MIMDDGTALKITDCAKGWRSVAIETYHGQRVTVTYHWI